MGAFHKKSEAGLVIMLVLVILVLFFGWLINFSQRECKSNKECSSDAYCGSDFSCHTYPNIQKTVVEYNFVFPAIMIAIAIIIAAVILKWKQKDNEGTHEAIPQPIEDHPKAPEQSAEQISEPYYRTGNPKTP